MELDSKKYIKIFTDIMSEGFIVINEKGIIEIYNKKAREIFCIDFNIDLSHQGGRIEDEDIIIIADNALGVDDGDLSLNDLRGLGLKSENLKGEEGLLLIGRYRSMVQPSYKVIAREDRYGYYKLEYEDICSSIDYSKRELNIEVAGKSYPLKYTKAIGHIVVLDGKTRRVKFFQYYGYTARGECIGDLLKGRDYISKDENMNKLRVIGRKIEDIHKSDSIIGKLINISRGKGREEHYIAEEINGISTLCTILKVKDGDRVVGGALKVEDISEIERVNREKNRVYEKLKEVEEKLFLEERLLKSFPNFVGSSREIIQVKKLALKASKNTSNVLILGKSGTGKSILARSIHENSRLKDKPFIEINCGAIPENLLESELFGYEKGAFTGAKDSGKPGLFQMANGGSIFLDEIGDLPKNLQVKILQIIQNKSFYPLGSTEKVQVDVRIITATNKNLEEEIINNRFREDLYYRINVFPIYIPELKDRREDIYDLVKLILPRLSKELGEEKTISVEALNKLYNYSWPGNIRELENILERGLTLSEGSTILSKDIKIKSLERVRLKTFKEQIELGEREIIENTLNLCKGNRLETMKVLDMSKSNFYKKLKDYNID